jgi:hypothetical protein
VVVAYVDFSKAFDTVSHEKLLYRLSSYGVSGNLLSWLRNYFNERSHQTRVGAALSAAADLLSGTIQGSVIGPLCFLAFINELILVLERCGIIAKLFADDVKMYISLLHDCDCDKLQSALNNLSEWAAKWQLSVSINKCCVVHVGRCVPLKDFVLGGCKLPVLESCRDLGVQITGNLSFETHINNIVAKAHQRACCILRCFLTRDVDVLLRAFKVYVRPLVEFNCVVWSPHLLKHIDLIENVQRRFTKRLHGMRDLSYGERLRVLHLASLEMRRLHQDLIFCYKIVFGLVDLNFSEFFTINNTGVLTRGHSYRLYKPRSLSSARQRFFNIRVIDCWNALPTCTDFGSLKSFKRCLMSIDLSKFIVRRYS